MGSGPSPCSSVWLQVGLFRSIVLIVGDGCRSAGLVYRSLGTTSTTTSFTSTSFAQLCWWIGEDSGTASAQCNACSLCYVVQRPILIYILVLFILMLILMMINRLALIFTQKNKQEPLVRMMLQLNVQPTRTHIKSCQISSNSMSSSSRQVRLLHTVLHRHSGYTPSEYGLELFTWLTATTSWHMSTPCCYWQKKKTNFS
jgi:hypothetical protein